MDNIPRNPWKKYVQTRNLVILGDIILFGKMFRTVINTGVAISIIGRQVTGYYEINGAAATFDPSKIEGINSNQLAIGPITPIVSSRTVEMQGIVKDRKFRTQVAVMDTQDTDIIIRMDVLAMTGFRILLNTESQEKRIKKNEKKKEKRRALQRTIWPRENKGIGSNSKSESKKIGFIVLLLY